MHQDDAEKFEDLNAGQAGLQQQIHGLDGRMRRVEKVLDGNGRPGLVEVVTQTAQTVNGIRQLAWVILAAIITSGVGLILEEAIKK